MVGIGSDRQKPGAAGESRRGPVRQKQKEGGWGKVREGNDIGGTRTLTVRMTNKKRRVQEHNTIKRGPIGCVEKNLHQGRDQSRGR